MATEWHYQKNGSEHGPITALQLKQFAENGQILPTDLVRRGDMVDWRPASQVRGLFGGIRSAATPPPLRPQSANPPPLPSEPGNTPDLRDAANLVLEDDTADGKPAGQVQSLFGTVPSVATPSALPPQSASPLSLPPDPHSTPDLGAAAKQFWFAAKAKAKDLGEKAREAVKDAGAKVTDAAKDLGVKAAEAVNDQRASAQQESAATAGSVKQPPVTGKSNVSSVPTSPQNPSPIAEQVNSLKGKAVQLWRRSPALVVSVGVVVLCFSCCICTGFFSLLSGLGGIPIASNRQTPSPARGGSANSKLPRGSREDSLGISEAKFLQPTPSFGLESTLAEAGCFLRHERDETAIRVWSLGPHKLAVTGPRDDLSGIFLLCGYTTSDTDNSKAGLLTLFTLGSVFNLNLGSSAKPPGSTEADRIMSWFTTLMGDKKSGEKIVHGLRVGFQNCAPISYQVSIQPAKSSTDPIDVFGLNPAARMFIKPSR